MKVWVVGVNSVIPTDSDSPMMYREGVLALHLAKRGHAVTWFNSTFDVIHRKQRLYRGDSLIHENVHIELIRSPGYKKNVSLGRLIDHHILARNFRHRASSMERPDVIYCCFAPPEVTYSAVKLKAEIEVPIVIDVRDIWPDLFYEVFPEFVRPVVKASLLWYRNLVSTALKGADSIISHSTGYLDWALQYAGRPKSDLDHLIMPGYPLYELSGDERIKVHKKFMRFGLSTDRDIVFYGGTMGRSYDFEPVVEVARMFDEEGRSPVFVLAGEGEMRTKWQDMAMDLPNVIFPGWLNGAELTYLQERSICGLQPYASHTLTSLPRKTAEYLSNGLPILSNLRGENEALLRSTGAGMMYDSTNSLYERIKEISGSETMRVEMSRNAVKAFRDNFRAETAQNRIESLLEEVVRRNQ